LKSQTKAISFGRGKVHPLWDDGFTIRLSNRRRRIFRRGDGAFAQTQKTQSTCPDHRKNSRVRSQSRRIDHGSKQLLHDTHFGSHPLSRSSPARKTGIAAVVFESARSTL